MSHAFRTQTPSPLSPILSKSESLCQAQSPSSLRLALDHASNGHAGRAPSAPRRFRFTHHARTQRAAHLCALARELPPDERALVLARFSDGRSGAQISALIGCDRHLVERRLRRLVARLSTPEFAYLAPRLNLFDDAQRSIARACIIEGRSIRSAAAHLNISQHSLREARAVLLALIRSNLPRPV